MYLHGGISRSKPGPGGRWWRDPERLTRDDVISVFPAGWNESLWWDWSQTENLIAILDAIRSEYNVDENRVYLFGLQAVLSG